MATSVIVSAAHDEKGRPTKPLNVDMVTSQLQLDFLIGVERRIGGFDLAAAGDGSWTMGAERGDDSLGRATICSDGAMLGGALPTDAPCMGRADNFEAEAAPRIDFQAYAQLAADRRGAQR